MRFPVTWCTTEVCPERRDNSFQVNTEWGSYSIGIGCVSMSVEGCSQPPPTWAIGSNRVLEGYLFFRISNWNEDVWHYKWPTWPDYWTYVSSMRRFLGSLRFGIGPEFLRHQVNFLWASLLDPQSQCVRRTYFCGQRTGYTKIVISLRKLLDDKIEKKQKNE